MVDCLGLPTCHRTQAGTGVRPASQRQRRGERERRNPAQSKKAGWDSCGSSRGRAQEAEAGGFATAAVHRARARRGAATPPLGVRSGSHGTDLVGQEQRIGKLRAALVADHAVGGGTQQAWQSQVP